MKNNRWLDDPVLSGIAPEKMEILTKIINSAGDMKPQQMLAYFMNESNKASQNGINFSDAETNAILNVLTADMSPKEKRQIETIRRMVNMLSKKGR